MRSTLLRRFLGEPRWRRWLQVLADAGLGEAKKGRLLTHRECRRVMEVWYRDLGEFRAKRWKASV